MDDVWGERKKERKEDEKEITAEDLINQFREGTLDVTSVGKERCMMCMLEGTDEPAAWRFINKVYCEKHKPMMDKLLRLQRPGKEPPWERI